MQGLLTVLREKGWVWQAVIFLLIGALVAGFFVLIQKKEPTPAEVATEALYRPLLENKCDKDDVIPQETFADMRRRYEEATKTLQQNSDLFNEWMRVASLKKTTCQYEDARDLWEYGSVIRPKNSLSFGSLGDLYANFLNEPEKAEENFLKAIENEETFYLSTNKVQPLELAFHRSLHELYRYTIRNKEKAEEVLLRAIRLDPKALDMMTVLAAYYHEEGRTDEALRWYEEALKVSPGNTGVQAEIDRIKGARSS